MRRDPFKLTLDHILTPEELHLRDEQARRGWGNLKRARANIDAAKARHKEEIAKLKAHELVVVETAETAAAAFEAGSEPRETMVYEVLRGLMIETLRVEDNEPADGVEARKATQQELLDGDEQADEEEDDLKPPADPLHGGGAAKAESKAKGYSPADLDAKIVADIAKVCKTPKPEGVLLKNLAKQIPEATPATLKAIVDREIKRGRLNEDSGKLLWIPDAPAPEDSGIVADDYVPTATH